MYTALPFGLSISPYVFTKAIKVFAAFLRRPVFRDSSVFTAPFFPRHIIKQGFTCLVYLDDLLILLSADSFLKRKIRLLFLMLKCFGLHINRKKSEQMEYCALQAISSKGATIVTVINRAGQEVRSEYASLVFQRILNN